MHRRSGDKRKESTDVTLYPNILALQNFLTGRRCTAASRNLRIGLQQKPNLFLCPVSAHRLSKYFGMPTAVFASSAPRHRNHFRAVKCPACSIRSPLTHSEGPGMLELCKERARFRKPCEISHTLIRPRHKTFAQILTPHEFVFPKRLGPPSSAPPRRI